MSLGLDDSSNEIGGVRTMPCDRAVKATCGQGDLATTNNSGNKILRKTPMAIGYRVHRIGNIYMDYVGLTAHRVAKISRRFAPTLHHKIQKKMAVTWGEGRSLENDERIGWHCCFGPIVTAPSVYAKPLVRRRAMK